MFSYKIPFSLFLLWLFSLAYIVFECFRVADGHLVFDSFSTFLPLIFLPVWIWGIDFIAHTRERTQHAPFFPAFLTILLLSIGILFLFHPSFLIFCLIIFWLFTIFGLLDARILFLVALIFLGIVIFFLGVEKQNMAEIFSILTYYALVLGVVSEIFSGLVVRLYLHFFSKISTPKILIEYIHELQNFSRIFIMVLPLLIFTAVVWFILQSDDWTLTVKYGVIEGAIPLLFLLLLFTPIERMGRIKKEIS